MALRRLNEKPLGSYFVHHQRNQTTFARAIIRATAKRSCPTEVPAREVNKPVSQHLLNVIRAFESDGYVGKPAIRRVKHRGHRAGIARNGLQLTCRHCVNQNRERKRRSRDFSVEIWGAGGDGSRFCRWPVSLFPNRDIWGGRRGRGKGPKRWVETKNAGRRSLVVRR